HGCSLVVSSLPTRSPFARLIDGSCHGPVWGLRNGRSGTPGGWLRDVKCTPEEGPESSPNHNILWFVTWSDRYILWKRHSWASTLDAPFPHLCPPARPWLSNAVGGLSTRTFQVLHASPVAVALESNARANRLSSVARTRPQERRRRKCHVSANRHACRDG